MEKNDFFYRSADGATEIHAIEWVPDGEVKAVLQISHGMQEYINRYDGFARYLCQNGFYVVGNDHLGHGKSVQNDDLHGFFAVPDGNSCVVADLHTLREKTQQRYPDVPYFLLGHSMGSFLARQYIELHGAGLAGAVIMGTGSQPAAVLAVAIALSRIIAAFRGWHYRSPFLDNLACGSYNKQFEPARTPKEWLTKDEKIVDAYLADPWCMFRFTTNAYYHMFRGIRFIQKKQNIDKIPKDLPVLFVSGECDPVGSNGKGVMTAFNAFCAAGIKNVQMKLYPNDRHELLNETDRQTVYSDLLTWFGKQMNRNASSEA